MPQARLVHFLYRLLQKNGFFIINFFLQVTTISKETQTV